MTSILETDLVAHARNVQLEKFTFVDFKYIETTAFKVEKFEDFNKLENKPDFKLKSETVFDIEKHDSSHDENINFPIYENYLSLAKESESAKGKAKEFVDTESESNVVYRTKVNLGRNKTLNLIVKDIIDSNNKLRNENKGIIGKDAKKIKEGDKLVCRVGQKDEIINLQSVVGKPYLF